MVGQLIVFFTSTKSSELVFHVVNIFSNSLIYIISTNSLIASNMAPPSKNKQWISGQDGIENLKQTESDVPIPGPNEVLVQINTVALNYRDTEVVMGLYNRKRYQV
jgi:hypothetical protein